MWDVDWFLLGRRRDVAGVWAGGINNDFIIYKIIPLKMCHNRVEGDFGGHQILKFIVLVT